MEKLKIFLFIVLISIINNSCSKKDIKKSVINEKSLDQQVLEAYSEGKKSLDEGDVLFAAKKFNEAEILFPQSEWAPKAALMAAYSYYKQDYYVDAIDEIKRFVRVYPKDPNLDYAYYLLAVCYYEQIVDEKTDLDSIKNAKESFEFILSNFSNTDYALDSEFKLDLINDILASKEMYVGRYYFEKKKWIAAINRFRIVVDEYDDTIYTEEALHRLVETYYIIGLKDEAKKYAQVLGYNYQSSKWYEMSYSMFNEKYDKQRIKNIKEKNSILSKAKSLFK
tara:strand:+ start:344 stop:1183 length:840 start_codon:yes stop_codon:yes gene_type:complete